LSGAATTLLLRSRRSSARLWRIGLAGFEEDLANGSRDEKLEYMLRARRRKGRRCAPSGFLAGLPSTSLRARKRCPSTGSGIPSRMAGSRQESLAGTACRAATKKRLTRFSATQRNPTPAAGYPSAPLGTSRRYKSCGAAEGGLLAAVCERREHKLDHMLRVRRREGRRCAPSGFLAGLKPCPSTARQMGEAAPNTVAGRSGASRLRKRSRAATAG